MHKYQQINCLRPIPINHTQQLFHLQLPKITKQSSGINDPPIFKRSDVAKIIEYILKKGNRFTQIKKQFQAEDVHTIERKLTQSCYLQFAIRKQLQVMGDERRIGNGLRGLNKLLLQQFETKIWSMIQIEVALFMKQKQQEIQRQRVQQILQ